MVIVLIRTRMRPDADPSAYEALNARMEALVATIPGYLGASGYVSDDGDEVAMIRFASQDALRVWREHPEHRAAQALGRSDFYAWYHIEVCEVVRAYEFGARAGSAQVG